MKMKKIKKRCHLSMISDTFLIPDPKVPDSLLTVGSLGAHQLFLLTPNTSASYLSLRDLSTVFRWLVQCLDSLVWRKQAESHPW